MRNHNPFLSTSVERRFGFSNTVTTNVDNTNNDDDDDDDYYDDEADAQENEDFFWDNFGNNPQWLNQE